MLIHDETLHQRGYRLRSGEYCFTEKSSRHIHVDIPDQVFPTLKLACYEVVQKFCQGKKTHIVCNVDPDRDISEEIMSAMAEVDGTVEQLLGSGHAYFVNCGISDLTDIGSFYERYKELAGQLDPTSKCIKTVYPILLHKDNGKKETYGRFCQMAFVDKYEAAVYLTVSHRCGLRPRFKDCDIKMMQYTIGDDRPTEYVLEDNHQDILALANNIKLAKARANITNGHIFKNRQR